MAVPGTLAHAGTSQGRRRAFRDFVRVITIGGLGLAGLPFNAQADSSIQRVESGKLTLLARYGNWTKTCKANERPDLTITRAPVNGFVSIRNTSFLVTKADAGGPSCKGLRVKGRALYYQSRKHYRGQDVVGFEVSKGPEAGAHTIQLTVR